MLSEFSLHSCSFGLSHSTDFFLAALTCLSLQPSSASAPHIPSSCLISSYLPLAANSTERAVCACPSPPTHPSPICLSPCRNATTPFANLTFLNLYLTSPLEKYSSISFCDLRCLFLVLFFSSYPLRLFQLSLLCSPLLLCPAIKCWGY